MSIKVKRTLGILGFGAASMNTDQVLDYAFSLDPVSITTNIIHLAIGLVMFLAFFPFDDIFRTQETTE